MVLKLKLCLDKSMAMHISLFVFLFLSSVLRAEVMTSKVYKTDEMNGFKLSDFPEFEKKWKLVTVRFRKDTGEMRFTYANDIAYQNLVKGVIDYPEGSVFAKIGIKTAEDSAFPSSAVPAGARRYQFMVKDKKKFASTEGWGYVLFDKGGTIYPEDPATQSAACAACHRIVPERGFVFSQMMELSVFKGGPEAAKKEVPYTEKIKFKTVKKDELPEAIKKEIPKEAINSKGPAFIVSPDGKTFALVFVENFEVMCEIEGKKGYFMKAVSTSGPGGVPNYENRYCWTH